VVVEPVQLVLMTEQAELQTREVVEAVQEGLPQHLLQEQAAPAVQA
jgi:hypothetical protein